MSFSKLSQFFVLHLMALTMLVGFAPKAVAGAHGVAVRVGVGGGGVGVGVAVGRPIGMGGFGGGCGGRFRCYGMGYAYRGGYYGFPVARAVGRAAYWSVRAVAHGVAAAGRFIFGRRCGRRC